MSKAPTISKEPLPPALAVSPRAVARLKSGHPWVYRSDLATLTSAERIPPGALVRVTDSRGKSLGTAIYSSSSQIAIRMIADKEAQIADFPALVRERLHDAIAYRNHHEIVANTDAYRVVFSEADFLPGLIVDRYNDVLSLQILTQAMDAEPVRGVIIETLVEAFQPAGIVERVDPRIRQLEQLPPRESTLLWGRKSSTIIAMNGADAGQQTSTPRRGKAQSRPAGADPAETQTGIHFHYDGLAGQKTGAFLDQRENYAAAARYAHGDALDVFCYQGGFALHMAGCSTVTGVDISRSALEMADKNAALNGREMEWIEANAFDLLRDYALSGRRYDTIVLDPPAFAKTRRDLRKALGGYKELNLRALRMLKPNGILITCSCSFHVSAAEFLEVVSDAARDTHRSLRLLENRGAAKDHPLLLNVPETGYLKCLIFNVK